MSCNNRMGLGHPESSWVVRGQRRQRRQNGAGRVRRSIGSWMAEGSSLKKQNARPGKGGSNRAAAAGLQ